MATTITAATLTVTLTEAVSLNGYDQGSKNTLTVSSVNEVNKRIVTVPTSEIEVVAMSTANAAGTFIESDVRYIRITNLDDTNHVTLTFKNENDDEFAVKLDKGQSFIFNGDLSGGVVDTMDGIDGTGLTVSLGDLVNITALADTAACDLEIFVASV
jgi:C-terminal processing protease CtpA/Prc|tara:strand:- start:543 stop:1013 length:471 start_codon:yes stop_codon:yes gene_type:complete